MAKLLHFKCESCNYTTKVYIGKGFWGQHITMVTCPDCQTIQPLVIGGVIGDAAPSFNTEVGRLCLNCGSANIRPWNMKTCPKCQKEMNPTREETFWM